MSVLDRIERLRNVMEQQKIDCYIIPTDDYHHSEYVGDYFKFREYITGSFQTFCAKSKQYFNDAPFSSAI